MSPEHNGVGGRSSQPGSTRPQSLPELFEHVVDLPLEQRAAFLKKLHGDDPQLAHRLEVLLENESKAARILADAAEPSALSDSSAETVLSPGSMRSGEGPLSPGTSFGPRYQIRRLLGRGGMGIVYEAFDSELGIPVALKVIRPDVFGPDIERRFKRELLLSRQVSHRNVIRIHDLGDVDGRKYITMAYVEGETLAVLLRQAGALPWQRSVGLASQLASGLAAAHQAGVVHRDFKPANVMVDGAGNAVIMDFGIARPVEPTEADVTRPTQIVGSLQYMAPEQLAGRPADPRSDVYAFGLVLQELLLGLQLGAEDLLALVTRRQEVPARPSSVNPTIPPGLDDIVVRCLQPVPEARYPSAVELAADLERLGHESHARPLPEQKPGRRRLLLAAGAAAVFIALAGVGWLAMKWATPAPPPQTDPVPLLVANLENQTGDEVFDGTIEQALTIALEEASFVTAMGRPEALRVILREKLGTALDERTARTLAIREGLHVLLVPAITRAGAGYALAVRVVDPTKDAPVAVAQASTPSRDKVLATFIGPVATQVLRTLGDASPESRTAAAQETFTTSSLEAVNDYARAQTLLVAGRSADAIGGYQSAVRRDPQFGRAYAGLALALDQLGRTDEAAVNWERALALMDRMTEREKLRTLGNYSAQKGNYDEAIDSYVRLLERYPYDRAAMNNLPICYFSRLDFSQALATGRRATEMYPTDVRKRVNYALYAMYAGDIGLARREAEQVIGVDPTAPKTYLVLAVAAFAEGRVEEARQHYATMAQKGGAVGASLAGLGVADLALAQGLPEQAVAALGPALAKDAQSGNKVGVATKRVALAEAQLSLDRRDEAAVSARAALAASSRIETTVQAARVLIALGRDSEARTVIAQLQDRPQAHARAYGLALEGELLAGDRRMGDVVARADAGRRVADLWLGRFLLGRTYASLGSGAEVGAQALGQLETCERRWGEATAVFLDDFPTLRYLAELPYWLGRTHQSLGQSGLARTDYQQFLSRRHADASDALTVDARRRLASLSGP